MDLGQADWWLQSVFYPKIVRCSHYWNAAGVIVAIKSSLQPDPMKFWHARCFFFARPDENVLIQANRFEATQTKKNKENVMEAIFLTCIQCDEDFEFSVSEQKKYNQRGFDAPLRCPECRKNKHKDSEQAEKRKFRDKKKHYRLKSSDYFD